MKELLALLVLAAALGAQEPAALRSARAHAAAGRTDSARSILRRLVIEQSNSPWADDALLDLARLMVSAGNPVAGYEYAVRLRSDYPGSELRAQAALAGGRAAVEAADPRTGCALLDSALAEAQDDVELTNEIGFHRSRCPALLAGPLVPRPADTVTAGYGVQVAAARSESEARRLAQLLQARGHPALLQRGDDGLTRVRIGPFRTRAEADSVAQVVRSLADGNPFIVRMP